MNIALKKKSGDTYHITFFFNKLLNKIRKNRMNASTKKWCAVTYKKQYTLLNISNLITYSTHESCALMVSKSNILHDEIFPAS